MKTIKKHNNKWAKKELALKSKLKNDFSDKLIEEDAQTLYGEMLNLGRLTYCFDINLDKKGTRYLSVTTSKSNELGDQVKSSIRISEKDLQQFSETFIRQILKFHQWEGHAMPIS